MFTSPHRTLLNYALPIALACGWYFMTPSLFADGLSESEKKAILQHAKSLPQSGLALYVRQLGYDNKLDALVAIYESGIPGSSMAAGEYAKRMSSDKVVAFCAQFDLDSDEWLAVFYALQDHPKEKVIGYIQQLSTSSVVEVRYCCYDVCRAAGWPELLTRARRDLSDETGIALPGMTFGETLGRCAQRYVKKVAPKAGAGKAD